MVNVFDAVRARDQRALNEYLESGGDVDARDSNGMTALILAVDVRCASIVGFLMEHHASPDLTDRWGQTALMLAAGRNDSRSAELLLAGGAAVDIKAKNGLTALQYATENGGRDVARMLSAAGDRRSAAASEHGTRRVHDGGTGTDRVLE